ncbi:MAG: patatin-like phospholipase family protein [Candidatus Wildermuthbacteria bacterium]|nr:patatin-like phospholipase family protein [Candidatus Wildermuthbacteria bacterium]
MLKKIDAVFEGGGVKGTGLVGAVSITEQSGYAFEHVAGTSAGAIVAACIAAGYTAKEMQEIMYGIEYAKFRDTGIEDKIPIIGSGISLLLTKGIYEGDFFEKWMRDILAKKGVRTFKDLRIQEYGDNPCHCYKLQVIASDLTRGRMLVLPRDMKEYDIDPDTVDVAWAVRMSMSIPFFYKPVVLKDRGGTPYYVVDGGILSNYPVWIFEEDGHSVSHPTIGYKLVDPEEGKPHSIGGPISLLKALFSTMMEAHDAKYIRTKNFMRTIPIETLGVQTTDFDITLRQKEALYESGKKAAEKFFKKWNFEEYKKKSSEFPENGRMNAVWDEKGS